MRSPLMFTSAGETSRPIASACPAAPSTLTDRRHDNYELDHKPPPPKLIYISKIYYLRLHFGQFIVVRSNGGEIRHATRTLTSHAPNISDVHGHVGGCGRAQSDPDARRGEVPARQCDEPRGPQDAGELRQGRRCDAEAAARS